jgi:hypothetical protein
VAGEAAELAGRAGQLMLVAAGLLLLLGLLLTLPRALRVRRRARRLIALVQASAAAIEEDLAGLQLRRQETEQALAPSRRLRRWLTHPLSVALFHSYRRRRRRAAAR